VKRFFGYRANLFLCAGAGGLVFFVPALQWMRVADDRMYVLWIALAVYCSLYVPVAILLLRRLDRGTRLPLLLTLPVVWTALEYFRVQFGTGFGWYLLGYSQHRFLAVIQISDLGGVYTVSFLVAAVNGLIFELLAARAWFRAFFALPQPASQPRLGPWVAAVALLFAASLGYGFWRLTGNDSTGGPRIALVQGNLEQRIRNASQLSDMARDHFSRLTQLTVGRAPRPDLIVWPETSYPSAWVEINPPRGDRADSLYQTLRTNLASKLNADLLAHAGQWKIPVLVGLNSRLLWEDRPEHEQSQLYNSAVLIQPGDRALVDGYAIRAADLPRQRGTLTIVDPDASGQTALGLLQAMPVRAGSLLPLGADAVIWEHHAVLQAGRQLRVDDPLWADEIVPIRPGQNVVGMAGRYDKMHLVPFGEYLPFHDWAPWMRRFAPYDFDYSVYPGEHFTRFPVTAAASGRTAHFGVLICFDDSDPDLARRYVRTDPDGAPVDFLLNISNDGWFDGTSEHDEHLAVCRFRAVECRRSLARAVNMGISAVIDANGRVLEPATVRHEEKGSEWQIDPDIEPARELPVARWAAFKKVAGVLTAVIPIDRRGSFYAAWGDWLAWLCWLGVASGIAMTFRRGRLARSPGARG
jgi:apolipoprotein N-acyltransferase